MKHRINITIDSEIIDAIEKYNADNPDDKINISAVCNKALKVELKEINDRRTHI